MCPHRFRKSSLYSTEDIGHFEPMFSHLLLPSPSVVKNFPYRQVVERTDRSPKPGLRRRAGNGR